MPIKKVSKNDKKEKVKKPKKAEKELPVADEEEVIAFHLDEVESDNEDEVAEVPVIIADASDEVKEGDATAADAESKHKIKGKHSLKYDSIFKGKKKKEDADDEFSIDFAVPRQENFEFDNSSCYHEETKDPEEYHRIKALKEQVYRIIVEKTDINIKNSRRKPGRTDYNKYYQVLIENIDTSKYSFGEIFIELAFYFSDNIFNMFKLLDKKWGGKIIKELAKKRNIKIDQIDFM